MKLPELHLADWRPTMETLHLYTQIVGKIRLAVAPPRNHWWSATLYADTRGLTTRRLHRRGTTFEIAFDFAAHTLEVATADGRTRSLELRGGGTVAGLDRWLHAALGELGVDVAIREEPFDVPATTSRFPDDAEPRPWDREAIERFGRVVDWSDAVFEEWSGWFNGKTSPVHFFWHGFDLAVTRFSGRRAPVRRAGRIAREAHSHELVSLGFRARDDTVGDAAYYAYAAPEPARLREQPLAAGVWAERGAGSVAVLPYAQVQAAADPRAMLLAFCQSAYEAGARLAGWDLAGFESTACPTPAEREALYAAAAA